MTGPKENSEVCFPETLNVPRGEAERNIEVEEKKTHFFPRGQSLSVFFISPDSKIGKKLRNNDLLDAYEGCAYSMSGSQTELYYRNDSIIVFFLTVNKNKDNAQIASNA